MSGPVCAFHPRRSTAATCARCQRPICRACVVTTSVGLKCPACVGARGSRHGDRRARRDRVVRRGAAVVTAVAAVVALVLAFGALGGRTELGIEGANVTADAGVRPANVEIPGPEGLFLPGILQAPAVGGPAAAALVVPRSEGADRDGVITTGGGSDPLYRDLADAMTRQGFAVLRYDQAPAHAGADQAAIARAALNFLGERPESAGPVTIVGHADGAAAAVELAARRPDVASLILISPTGPIPSQAAVDAPVLLVAGDAPLHDVRARLSAARSVDVLRVPQAGSTLRLGDAPGARDRTALHRVALWARGTLHTVAESGSGAKGSTGPGGHP